jgi:Tol biopolymer transport system component
MREYSERTYSTGLMLYSPDGAKIIFENVPNDGSSPKDIWIIDVDGNSRQKIISNGEMPDWK